MSRPARIYFDVPLWHWSRQVREEWAAHGADPRLLLMWEVAGRLLRVRDIADGPAAFMIDRRRMPAARRPPRVAFSADERSSVRFIVEHLRDAWAEFECGDMASGDLSLSLAAGLTHSLEYRIQNSTQPAVKLATKHKQEQSERAKKPRKGIVSAIADRLANRRDALGDYLSPLDLWPALVSELERDEREPVENGHTKAEHMEVEYDDRKGGRKTLTMGTWRATLQRARKKSP